MEQIAQEYLYDAFISYSRKDEKFARRLEAELERYKLPKGLPCYKRKLNIFRDVQDMVGNELSDAIKTGLRNSRHLIVICSPHSRQSRWVSKEIAEFIDQHGREKVLPVLIFGRPNSEIQSEMEDSLKAFPDILYHYFDEPFAADFRMLPGLTFSEKRTKWREAKFQVLAFLFEKEKEELLRRQRIRTLRILSSFVIIFLVLAIVFGRIAWIAERNATIARKNEITANQERDRADSLAQVARVERDNALRQKNRADSSAVVATEQAEIARKERDIAEERRLMANYRLAKVFEGKALNALELENDVQKAWLFATAAWQQEIPAESLAIGPISIRQLFNAGLFGNGLNQRWFSPSACFHDGPVN